MVTSNKIEFCMGNKLSQYKAVELVLTKTGVAPTGRVDAFHAVDRVAAQKMLLTHQQRMLGKAKALLSPSGRLKGAVKTSKTTGWLIISERRVP